jgi:hypothetical protein
VQIDTRPPLVWLVAPALRFHSATEILLKIFIAGNANHPRRPK